MYSQVDRATLFRAARAFFRVATFVCTVGVHCVCNDGALCGCALWVCTVCAMIVQRVPSSELPHLCAMMVHCVQ